MPIPKLFSALIAFALGAQSAAATVILADAFDDVGSAQKLGNVASFGSWDTVNAIDSPTSSLAFLRDDTLAAVGFHDVSDGEIDVNSNVGDDQPWRTSIVFDLDASTSTIDLTSLVLDMRLVNGSGNDNNTGSKSGRMAILLEGSVSGSLGAVDPGDSSYPSVEYTRTLDLTALPTLDGSETYTLTIRALGTGFGHHKSLQALELNGEVVAVPEASCLSLLGLGMLVALRRRRFQASAA